MESWRSIRNVNDGISGCLGIVLDKFSNYVHSAEISSKSLRRMSLCGGCEGAGLLVQPMMKLSYIRLISMGGGG